MLQKGVGRRGVKQSELPVDSVSSLSYTMLLQHSISETIDF